MASITKEISVDVAKRNLFQAIVAKQDDTHSRYLKCTITNEGEKITIVSSSTVIINARRADGNAQAFLGSVNDDGTVTVPLATWMLELDDVVTCDISIVDTESRKLTTLSFSLEVEAASYNGDDISEDPNYSLLVALLAECAETKQDCENATENANSATRAANNAATDASEAAVVATEAAEEAQEISDYYGSPLVASTVAEMTQTNRVYVYLGSETGYTYGNWYYYNGTAWLSGGVYCSTTTDGTIVKDTDTNESYRIQFRLIGGKPAILYESI